MIFACIGKFITVDVLIPEDTPGALQTRQGILIAFAPAGEPIILGESGVVRIGVSPDYTVVPDGNLFGSTLEFVKEWRRMNLR